MDISEEAMKWKMPALLVQPLMENAIKFGLYGTTGEVLISLQAIVANDHLVITIVNPFDSDMQMPEGTGFGLKSVRRRLYLLFGRSDWYKLIKPKTLLLSFSKYLIAELMSKVIIIDDEPLARSIVKEYLQKHPQLELVQECNDGFEGVKAIQQHEPDLIFLDIQMPKINGFEMLELIEQPPAVIFRYPPLMISPSKHLKRMR
ncbi:MAG: response regulator [Chitinophagaceae bacterium]